MNPTLNIFRCKITNPVISRCISSQTSRNLLKLNQNVHKILCRRKALTTAEEFAKLRKFKMIGTSKRILYPDKITQFAYMLLIIPISAFGLGTWQIFRLQWKNKLVEELNERINLPVIPLPEDFQELQNMEYRRVKVKGKFIHEKEFVVGPKTLIKDGKLATEEKLIGLFSDSELSKGHYVITPFKLEGRPETILVNRGWVPSHKKNVHSRKSGQIEDTVELIGVIRLNENRPQFIPHNTPEKGVWLYRDIYAMAKMTGSSPVYIDADYNSTVPDGPIGGQTRVILRNEHLSYVFTWYSLFAITSWMWYRQNIRKLPLL